MKIQAKDTYHGSALTQIVEHNEFKALNRASPKYGHYLINADTTIHIRHSTSDGTKWTYTLKTDDITCINEDVAASKRVFIVLVCGRTTVCILNQEEFSLLLNLNDNQTDDSTKWVTVENPPGGSMRVYSREGILDWVIPHNAFPKRLFE